jgi:hypothetical protein
MNIYYPTQYDPWRRELPAQSNQVIPLEYQVTPLADLKYKNDLTDLIGIHDAWLPERRWDSMAQDPAKMILGEKSDLAKLTVGAFVYQMIQRERIKEENLLRILYQEIAIDSQIMQLDAAWPKGMLPQDDMTKMKLQMELIKIDKEKREVQVDCWKDITRLKETLLEHFGNYRNAARKVELIQTGLPIEKTELETAHYGN